MGYKTPEVKRKKIQSQMERDFDEWIRELEVPVFNLSASKQDTYFELLNLIVNDKICSCDKLVQSIFKTYYLRDPQEVAKHCNLIFSSIRNPVELVSKFLNNQIIENPQEQVQLKEVLDVYTALNNIYIQPIIDFSGDIVFTGFAKLMFAKYNAFKENFLKKIRSQGFCFNDKAADFYMKKKPSSFDEATVAQNQRFVFSFYETVVKQYIEKYLDHISYGMPAADFDELWSVVGRYLQGLEMHLSKETKTNSRFVALKKEVDAFYANKLEITRGKFTKEGQDGRYATKVFESIKRYSERKATEKDMQALSEFEDRLKFLDMALKITDSHGNFPLNAYVFLPMHMTTAARLIGSFVACGFLDKETARKVLQTKVLLNNSFSQSHLQKTTLIESPDFALSEFRIKRTVGGKVYDFSTEESFAKLKKKVQKIVDQYNLPHFLGVYNLIASDLTRGRYPINLRGLQQPNATIGTESSAGRGSVNGAEKGAGNGAQDSAASKGAIGAENGAANIKKVQKKCKE